MSQLLTFKNNTHRTITIYPDFILMPGMNPVPEKYSNSDEELDKLRGLVQPYIRAKIIEVVKIEKEQDENGNDSNYEGIRSLKVEDAVSLITETFDIMKLEEYKGLDERIKVQKAINDQLKYIEEQNQKDKDE